MGKPWEIFENLDEIVYVSDMDSCEMVYMNKCALRTYGYTSLEQIKGKKCYDILQGQIAPCSVCTNACLKPNDYYEWEYHNHKLGKSYSLKDTMFEIDGKRYRMEMAIDRNIQTEQKKIIETMMFTETVINEGIALALKEENATKSIEIFMEHLGINTESDRVYIFEEKQGRYVQNTFEWCAESVIPQKDNLQEVPLEVVSVWYDAFEQNKNIIISNVEDIKETETVIYDYLIPQNIQSLVVSPLIEGSKIIGFYGVDNPAKERLSHVSNMAWIAGHFIVSMLKKQELVARLKQLSHFDQLTGLQNRHALNELGHYTNELKNVGIIYCDVMGLKKVNDSLGHIEGDNLLLRAGKCLRKQFRVDDLYRIGGDEFLIICNGIEENEFYNRIEKLRCDMKENNALMALGCLWKKKADDIDMLIAKADELMYEEKQNYYK